MMRVSAEARLDDVEVIESVKYCCVACCTVSSDQLVETDLETRTVRVEKVVSDAVVGRFCVADRVGTDVMRMARTGVGRGGTAAAPMAVTMDTMPRKALVLREGTAEATGMTGRTRRTGLGQCEEIGRVADTNDQ